MRASDRVGQTLWIGPMLVCSPHDYVYGAAGPVRWQWPAGAGMDRVLAVTSDCPSAEAFLQFVRGELDEAAALQLERHLDECSACDQLLAELARSPLAARDAPSGSAGVDASLPVLLPRLRRVGDRIGRYRIVGELGRGGMGVVYAARDPELQRIVALKLLRPRLATGVAGRARLLAEARALARIQHPNVVEVYDVGAEGDEVFLAMRHVAGVTLGVYARDPSRTRAEILQRCLQAGRGLEAAHRAGVVHRDFKPANVLVDTDGVAIVVDFGLASAEADHEDRITHDDAVTTEEALVQIVGTPAYMPPEQRRGAPPDPKSDQYSYCLTLRECLEGRADRPVSRIFERGLCPDASDRYPSMTDLLVALDRAARPHATVPSRRIVLASALMLSPLALLSAGPDPDCTEQAASSSLGWNDERAKEIGVAFAGSQTPFASDAAGRIDDALTSFDATWRTAYADACEAREDPAARDRELACLRDQQSVAQTLLQVWQDPQLEDLLQVSRALERVPDPSACMQEHDDDPRLAEQQAALDRAVARFDAGRLREGIEAAGQVAVQAERLDDQGLLARAEVELGRMYIRASELEEAERALQLALWWAQAEGDDALVARVLNELAWLAGYLQADLPAARRHVRHAQAAIERIGGDDELEGVRRRNAGWIALRAGDPKQALDDFEASLRLGCSDCRDRPIALVDVSTALTEQGRFDEAIEYLHQALEEMTERVGPEHPDLAVVLNNLAANYRYQQRFEEALALYDRIAASFQGAYGPDHAQVGRVNLNQGTVLADLQRYDEALRKYEAAERILREDLGADHPELARVHDGRATVLQAQGDRGAAIRELERAVTIKEAALGGEHPQLAITLANLGLLRLEVGEMQRAKEELQRADALLAGHLPADHPHRVGIAEALAAIR